MTCGHPLSCAYSPSALHVINSNPYIDFGPFELKIGTLVTSGLRNLYNNFAFFYTVCFRVVSLYGIDGQTDGQSRPVMRLIRTAA